MNIQRLVPPPFAEVRMRRAMRPLTDRWQQVPVTTPGTTRLGISFRPLQADALGLDARATMRTLLAYPFQLIRLGAYWSRIESHAGEFVFDELDWQVEAAERAGKHIILCVGAVKTFGYPEYFVPSHHLKQPLREGTRVEPTTHRSLLTAASAFAVRVVERFRVCPAIVAWQVEHEAVDPLGMEHSWRLATSFVREEVAAVRAADPTRPIMLNGFLPTSALVGMQQWWRTRDQGDSLAFAQEVADIVGIDYYPCHALAHMRAQTVYLDGATSTWQRSRRQRLFEWAAAQGRHVMISEGQAEPWETVTTPPNPSDWGMSSCLPERVIQNYNQGIGWAQGTLRLWAYLFWGAEYWVLRDQCGDSRYLRAFARVVNCA